MKLNRRRIDARIPNWLYNELMTMAEKRGWSFTEILEATAEKGLNWYKKNWDKRNDVKSPDEPREEAGHDERRSNTHQKSINDEELTKEINKFCEEWENPMNKDKYDELLAKLKNHQAYRKFLKERNATDGSFMFDMFITATTGKAWDQITDPDGTKIMSKALEILDGKQTDISESSR